MLTFQLEDGKQIQIDREHVEEKLLMSIFDRLEEARQKDKGMYNGLKAAVNLMMTFTGNHVNIPKGENVLEYLIAHYVSMGIDALEQKPLEVSGVVVDAKEAAPNGKTD